MSKGKITVLEVGVGTCLVHDDAQQVVYEIVIQSDDGTIIPLSVAPICEQCITDLHTALGGSDVASSITLPDDYIARFATALKG